MELTPERYDNTKKNFAALIAALEKRKLKYTVQSTDPDRPHVVISFTGEDLPLSLHIVMWGDRQVISILSAMPFHITEDRRMEAALAVTCANQRLIDGSFDLNMENGELRFRLTSTFLGTVMTEEAFIYMIYTAADTIDRYNDRFMLVNTGELSAEEFAAAEHHKSAAAQEEA